MWLFEIVVAIHALPARADAARHSPLRWTVLRLGPRATSNGYLRNSSYSHRSFEITDRTWHARWFFPRHLSLRKRAARRVDQSDNPRCGVEYPGRDTDCLPVLSRGLCPQRKSLHAVLHDTDRSFSETDRLSVPLAKCPCSLEPSIRHRLTRRYRTRRRKLSNYASDPLIDLLLLPSNF